jgi:hypothetical protein
MEGGLNGDRKTMEKNKQWRVDYILKKIDPTIKSKQPSRRTQSEARILVWIPIQGTVRADGLLRSNTPTPEDPECSSFSKTEFTKWDVCDTVDSASTSAKP